MKLYSIAEVAEILGMNAETIKRYIYREELKAYKVGNQWRIKKEDLDRFVFKNSNIEGGKDGE